MHDCVVPLTAWIGTIFEGLRKESKIPARVRAVDMRNILLVLPFLLHNLLEEEVEEYNRHNPFDPVVDPSDECIGIVLLFIDFYHLFRRRYPPKDEVDIQDLQVLSLWYYIIQLILLTNTLFTYFTYFTYVKLTCLFLDSWTCVALSFRSKTRKIVFIWQQRKYIALFIPQMTLITLVTI
jgi:hypothetical protein